MLKGIFFVFLCLILLLTACQNEAETNETETNEISEQTESQETGNEGATEQTEDDGTAGHDVPTEITGIDAGAGTMVVAGEVLEAYDVDIELVPSSDAAMTADLTHAVENEEEIIVVGWQPHWKFAAFDLKFLEDPKNEFGEEEKIHTLVREGLDEDHPSAFEVLDRFYWEVEQMNEVMIGFGQGDLEPAESAEQWIEENRDVVDSWINGVEPVDGESIELVYVTWDSEVASTNVIAQVLEEVGYDVEMSPVETGFMFSGLAAGEVDAMVAAWLPVADAAYYEEYGDQLIDLGPNLEGAIQGFVVPEYMDIDSIEDLPQN